MFSFFNNSFPKVLLASLIFNSEIKNYFAASCMGAKGNKLAKLYAFDNSRYSRKAKTIEITIIESWKSFSESTYSVKFVLSHPACRTFEKAALKLVSSGQAVFVYQGF